MSVNVLQPPQVGNNKQQFWGQLPGSAKALVLAQAAQAGEGPCLVITADIAQANQLRHELQFFAGKDFPVHVFADWETLPYDTFSPHEDIISTRLRLLTQLPALKKGIVIAAVSSLMHPVMPPEYLQSTSLFLNRSDKLSVDDFRHRLVESGYRAVEQVMQHGEFTFRGSIIDLFPMGAKRPYRIDLLDDEIDSIRTFDPDTQRSIDTIDKIQLLPAKEFPLTKESIATFRDNWEDMFPGKNRNCPIYRDVSEGISPAGIEYYLPLFYSKQASLFDYLPQKMTVFTFSKVHQSAEQFWQEVNLRYDQYGHDVTKPLLKPQAIFLTVDKVFQCIKQCPQVALQEHPYQESAGKFNFACYAMPDVLIDAQKSEPLAKLQHALETSKQRVLFVAETAGREQALKDVFDKIKMRPNSVGSWQQFMTSDDTLAMTVGRLASGLNATDPNLLIISEADLYGEKVMQRRLRKQGPRQEDNFIHSLMELELNMPVVHIDEGIGRYAGLKTIATDGVSTEFAMLEYAEGAKLYVPIANLHLLSRYTGGDSESAPLHHLGSEQWKKSKAKAAARARDVAAELLDLYARRAANEGQKCLPPDDEYESFAATFPFEETADQERAINEVIKDMIASTPMDRLICGDVGFGKTEVAMRAAFLAVHNHYQVAILVPTTLLAEQHYQNFIDRFAKWPVRIDLLSRFRSKKQADETLEAMANGKVDIVIGTHKLLQEKIKFANIGLLVIDEEHRFGVKQKERVKAMRTNVNILTLTATPIPRTLNMSLAKIRELSLIVTPPEKRLSIKTFVHEHNKTIIREAILREIMRGGQVYFLHNNVQTIEATTRAIAEIVPEANIQSAHGQMRERELEAIMTDFYHQRFNVLVCTTIIETGIDVPTANTIIMNRADKLGLAQLHQLRGRVGRSHHQAYAYLLIPGKKLITKDAEKRLDAIVEANTLGAGFTLARQDLEIRGAGELLGQKQSGQIASVGFSLYMEFLDKAVEALQSGKQPDFDKPLISHTEIDCHLSAIIPETYIHDVHLRLSLYKRIASAKDDVEIKDLQVEMIDRFGLLPEEVKNLFTVTQLKIDANKLGIKKIQVGLESGFIIFDNEPNIEPIRLIQLIQKYPRIYKLQGAQRLNFTLPMPTHKHRFDTVRQILRLLT